MSTSRCRSPRNGDPVSRWRSRSAVRQRQYANHQGHAGCGLAPLLRAAHRAGAAPAVWWCVPQSRPRPSSVRRISCTRCGRYFSASPHVYAAIRMRRRGCPKRARPRSRSSSPTRMFASTASENGDAGVGMLNGVMRRYAARRQSGQRVRSRSDCSPQTLHAQGP